MSLPSDEAIHRRIVALEELYLHAERRLLDLNEALVSQQRQISTLEARLANWMSQSQENERTLGGDHAADEQAAPGSYIGSNENSPDGDNRLS